MFKLPADARITPMKRGFLSSTLTYLTLTILSCAAFVAFAALGVGIGTGKITVEEKLKPGTIYELPSLVILNTGDEPSEYKVGVAYHQDQPQIAPPKEWFSFYPETFQLNPGEAKEVKIKLNLPIKTKPGDYFAYLEGSPTRTSTGGTTSVGIAAAAKLYFSVAPANFIQGLYYRIASFWKIYTPWTNIAATALFVVLLVKLFGKKFNIQFSVKKKDQDEDLS